MASGDILFYTSRGSFFDRLIVWGTHGPFVHCEIDLGDGTSIGALSHGVTRHVVRSPAAVASVGEQLAARRSMRLQVALVWLEKQVGRRYGWWDIVADAFKTILPTCLGSRTPFLVMPSEYDCSELAAVFLAIAGANLPSAVITDLQRTSPNDLARALGVTLA